MTDDDRAARLGARAAGTLADLGRVEALVAEMLRAGRAPVLALGVVPLAELSAVRLGVFVEAGSVVPPGWEGWLPQEVADQLVDRHDGLRRACWDASVVRCWSIAWTVDPGPLVVWNTEGSRLRVGDGVVDVLDRGRWTVVPTGRIGRVSLAGEADGVGQIRLHMLDGRLVAFEVGRSDAAALVAERVADVLGVEWSAARWHI